MEYNSGDIVRPTNFAHIELEKENILPLKDGRSAKRLSEILQQDSLDLNSTRLAYERRLLDDLEDLDDPLELFLDYITWLNDVSPQGGTSKKSGILDVMERCLMYFRDMETYKNDPRLLKLWLWYIELFSRNSNQESSDIFVYMLRKRIGSKLSLYYEEFSGLLFEMKRYKEAYHMMKLGINESARPQSRLSRRLSDFEVKLREMNIDFHSPLTDTHFLESQSPRFVLGRERSSIISDRTELNHTSHERLQNDSSNNVSLKYKVFNDGGAFNNENDRIHNEGWDVLDAVSNKNKENKSPKSNLAASSNLGKLRQEESLALLEGKPSMEKLPIFKDSIGRSDPVYKILEVPGKKPEKIDCNFKLLYPNSNEEFCIEEILAISRKIYYKRNDKSRLDNEDRSHTTISNETQAKKRKKAPLSEKTVEYISSNMPLPNQLSDSHQTKMSSKTSILPLNDITDDEINVNSQNEKNIHTPNSPTVTYFSKNAMNEVYSMFNQNYNEISATVENDDTKNKFALFDNFTQEFTRQNMDDLTEVKSQNTDEKVDVDKSNHPMHDNDIKSNNVKTHPEIVPSLSDGKSRYQGFMTSIPEKGEKSFVGYESNDHEDLLTKNQSDTAASSPFLTQPQHGIEQQNTAVNVSPVIENPMDERLRKHLLETIEPSLDKYDTFYRYNQSLKMSSLLKKIHRVSKSKNKNPIVDFKKTGDLYCIRSELGEGGYATVYLAESSTGKLRALKVEKPASVWEFYILKQIERRLKGDNVLRSIINASSLHCFQDESYLVLNYANQGTILDLINLQREKSNGPVEELLCMFITVELMKVVEALHETGIIHGDLKPDNCMVRFEAGNLGPFNTDGSYGWCNKGIYLIDFGRSFDMSLLPPGSKFRANWKTDQQDCYEMRHGEPWSYEADYYGLAGIVHSMLFGEFIETSKSADGTLMLKKPLRRYWSQEIWSAVFDTLLNSRKHSNLPITSKLMQERNRIENYMKCNANDKLRDIIFDWEADLLRLKK